MAVLVGLGLGHSVWRVSTSNTPIASNNGGTGTNGGTGNSSQNPFGSTSPGASGPSSTTVSAVAGRVAPALVDIDTNLYQNSGEAAGTGIVLNSDGLVLTNNHVISGAAQITATDIGNGKTYPAQVVGYDRTHDVALIQLQGAHGLETATLGSSSHISVGTDIIGIGNAGGVGGAPTSVGGTVTDLNQSITATDEASGSTEQLSGLIQVNADIQPGDSGGSLVNLRGQVLGIDTAASQSFSFQSDTGQGFAIPINQAVSIAKEIESGHSTSAVHIGSTAFLGVYVCTTTGDGCTVSQGGATLAKVVANGPAAAAGLGANDLVTSLGGQPVTSASSLTELLVPYHPGDRIEIGWSDSTGVTHRGEVTLGSGPAA